MFLNGDEGIMISVSIVEESPLLWCITIWLNIYQYIGIIHLTVAKKCYNIILNVETRQPYHTKVLKWSLTSWSVLGENRVSSYHRVILLGNFQAVTDHHAHIQGSFTLQFILQVWIKYLKKTKFIATCYPPLYIFRVLNSCYYSWAHGTAVLVAEGAKARLSGQMKSPQERFVWPFDLWTDFFVCVCRAGHLSSLILCWKSW